MAANGILVVIVETTTNQRGDNLFDLVRLAVFLVVNFFMLRWLARKLVSESAWLRDPNQPKTILPPDELSELLSPLPFNDRTVRLLGCVVLIGLLIWVDYLTIRTEWPWLLGG